MRKRRKILKYVYFRIRILCVCVFFHLPYDTLHNAHALMLLSLNALGTKPRINCYHILLNLRSVKTIMILLI